MSEKLTKIMLVEDEPDIRAIAQIALEDIGGFKVKFCESGQEALKEVELFDPDLIVLDVMMPGMDGPETLTHLRKIAKYEKTPVVFMTAKVQSNEVEEFRQLGALDVIPKPFDPMELANILNSIWNKHHG